MKRDTIFRNLLVGDAHAGPALTGIAALMLRAGFVGGLGAFFWRSALSKLDGAGLSPGAYAQILPAQAAAVGYDPAALAWPWHAIVAAGTAAEFVLPALILVGLLTRGAALAMIGFVVVMTVVDVTGHGVALADIAGQRVLWLAVLGAIAALGAGPVSADRALWPGRDRAGTAAAAAPPARRPAVSRPASP